MTSNTDKPTKGTNPLFDTQNESDDDAFIFRDDMSDEDLVALLNSPTSVGVSSRKPVDKDTKVQQKDSKPDNAFDLKKPPAETNATTPSKKMTDLLASVRESQNYHPAEPKSGTTDALAVHKKDDAITDFEFSLMDELESSSENKHITLPAQTDSVQAVMPSKKAAESEAKRGDDTGYEFSFSDAQAEDDSQNDNVDEVHETVADVSVAVAAGSAADTAKQLPSDMAQPVGFQESSIHNDVSPSEDANVQVETDVDDTAAISATNTVSALAGQNSHKESAVATKTVVNEHAIQASATRVTAQSSELKSTVTPNAASLTPQSSVENKQQLDREKLRAIFGGTEGNLTINTSQRQSNTVDNTNLTQQSSATLKSSTGVTNMTNETKIKQIQVEISELKGKLHAMGSDFFNAATDSAGLISQLRDLQTSTGGDFPETYDQGRKLRATLVEARKNFNELASIVDFLEEALEDNLYSLEVKS